MKVVDVQTIYEGLITLKDKKLPIRLSLVVSRNIKKLEEALKDIDEKRLELLRPYVETDEYGNIVNNNGKFKIKSDAKLNNLNNELDSLMNTELEITLDSVDLDIIEKCEEEGFDVPTVKEANALISMSNRQGDL